MELSRRDLAVAGALAVAFGATSLIGPALAESGDEAAVKKAVEEMRTAYIKQDKAALEAMTMPQLTYSHSDGRIEDKAQFIKGVMDRKATVKSLEYPDLTIHVVGDVAIARHLLVLGDRARRQDDQHEDRRHAGVQEAGRRLEAAGARSSYRLPEKA